MNVALDVSHLDHAQLSGVGVYTVQLLRALRRLSDVNVHPVWRPSRWSRRHFFNSHAGPASPWLARGLGQGADVLHGPDFRVSKTLGAKRVVTIHDLAFLVQGMTSPEFALKKKRDLDRLLDDQTPDAIIAISQATKRHLLNYRPQLESRVHVVPLGGDHLLAETKSPSGPAPVRSPYFLFVGNIEARKNVLGILTAFERFRARGGEARLVLIGKPGYDGERILAAIKDSPQAQYIDLVGYCTPAELNSYYRSAVALVYPSWIEGFGIPVVEAMCNGCPVITSATTATAEVAGNTAWLVEPSDPQAITLAMESAMASLADTHRRQDWIDRARARAATFKWDERAAQTVQVYKAAISGRR